MSHDNVNDKVNGNVNGDLISREALAEKFKKAKSYVQSDLLKIILGDVVDAIEGAPTIDAAPVVHGRWNDGVCSNCKFDALYFENECVQVYSNFCPNCGAKMDGDKREPLE